ncbi:hypothetical protein HNQ69_000814 [Bartonella callosciuri]|uniref:Uncharacterized protein n=1 Tax=Bartonella callosciuri TaxID=686223 RepID=A0A840NTH0_9HYPH|nr:hypothetical protein [Bartonella callosciuri]
MNRYQLKTFVMTNRLFTLPDGKLIQKIVVSDGLDCA